MNRGKERMKKYLQAENFHTTKTDVWEREEFVGSTKIVYKKNKFFMVKGGHEIEIETQEDIRIARELLMGPHNITGHTFVRILC
jgi:CMP-N-acetylneuraminic acid synthetase